MGKRDGPIFSTRADDPDIAESIDRYVIGLAERIDALQDAESRGDLARVGRLAAELGGEAEAVGFEALVAGAREVERACREEIPGEVHAGLVELTELSRRIRLGHRGAA